MIRNIELSEIDWLGIKEKLPIGESAQDEENRSIIWRQFDPNGNGLVSVAEADLAFRRMAGPLLPIYYSKKVQLLAFNQAKGTGIGENGQQEDFIERPTFRKFLIHVIKYFGYYFLFKNLDQDNDERLRVNDFITGLMLLRQWGADIKDVKDAKKWFYKYDENKGGVMLMDEWILFAQEMNLDVEKNAIIKEIENKPRVVYKLKEYMKAGSKRPSQIDPELWASKSPVKSLTKIDEEIQKRLEQDKQLLQQGQKQIKKFTKGTKSTRNQNVTQIVSGYYHKQEDEDEKTYDQLEKEIFELDEENYLLKEQLRELKVQLSQMKKIAKSQVIVI